MIIRVSFASIIAGRPNSCLERATRALSCVGSALRQQFCGTCILVPGAITSRHVQGWLEDTVDSAFCSWDELATALQWVPRSFHPAH